MLVQPLPIIIKSMFVSQNCLGDNGTTTTPTKEKKSWKVKISSKPFIKEAFAKTKRLNVNNLVDDLANIVGSTFFQDARDPADYEDCVLAYYYYLSPIFCSFNQV